MVRGGSHLTCAVNLGRLDIAVRVFIPTLTGDKYKVRDRQTDRQTEIDGQIQRQNDRQTGRDRLIDRQKEIGS